MSHTIKWTLIFNSKGSTIWISYVILIVLQLRCLWYLLEQTNLTNFTFVFRFSCILSNREMTSPALFSCPKSLGSRLWFRQSPIFLISAAVHFNVNLFLYHLYDKPISSVVSTANIDWQYVKGSPRLYFCPLQSTAHYPTKYEWPNSRNNPIC